MGCDGFIFSKKLTYLREKLRSWVKCSFGSIKLRELSLMHELEELDIVKETRKLNQLQARQKHVLHESLGKIHKQEEIYWKQRSRLQWLKRGG